MTLESLINMMTPYQKCLCCRATGYATAQEILRCYITQFVTRFKNCNSMFFRAKWKQMFPHLSMGKEWKVFVNNFSRRPRHMWEYNIKMNHQRLGWGDMEWFDLVQDRDRWWAPVNTMMKVWVPKSESNFFTTWKLVSFWKGTVL